MGSGSVTTPDALALGAQPNDGHVVQQQPGFPAKEIPTISVAVLGLGYVGLPTGIGLATGGAKVTGIDVSERRLQDIREGSVDLAAGEREHLRSALELNGLMLTSSPGALEAADAVMICVPTPVDDRLEPDLRMLRAACETVVAHARRDQVIVLTSTTYVGSTQELLAQPLAERGLRPGREIFVAFSPERIDPGNGHWDQCDVPRVVGGVTDRCAREAAQIVGSVSAGVHIVSSCEAAEMTKLYENTFRAVNIAWANEMAGASRAFGLDPHEITRAAGTKPYGILTFRPGAGVGGHCIPCDPHYLLRGLRDRRADAPLTRRAMKAIESRPHVVAERVIELLEEAGVDPAEGRVLVVGASYKPGVRDTRESPAVRIMRSLWGEGVAVAYHDPLVRSLEAGDGLAILSAAHPRACDYDLAVLVTLHDGFDYGWLGEFEHVLDCTYRTPLGAKRSLI
ncbi:MAG TPA: nucleotide sugar dehydrogenase [Solirubrobacterales bacterium]|nr:nucleotide sugar dehydrogenase [Solirubrobacterales bacterium]